MNRQKDFLLTEETIFFEFISSVEQIKRAGNAEEALEAFRFAKEIYAEKKNFLGMFLFENAVLAAKIILDTTSLGISSVIAAMLYDAVKTNLVAKELVEQKFGKTIIVIIDGLIKLSSLDTEGIALRKSFDGKKTIAEQKKMENSQTENFIKLLLTYASDVRSIILRLVFRLNLVQNLHLLNDTERQIAIAKETWRTHSPVAHRLGLYNIKTELEELSMKYAETAIYKDIAEKLNETKSKRDSFINNFIEPIKKLLKAKNLNCDVKGRPKSIYSIWNKMKKQQVGFEGIYDIFAIRIILDDNYSFERNNEIVYNYTREKSDCWEVYSLITDIYTPNPKRLRDWISSPKNSGYESLHTTVLGPEGKWVEVQIRSRRMDEIAEKGQAAHWKYKGGQSQGNEAWLANIREMLENSGSLPLDTVNQAKQELYSLDEIFIFTPDKEIKKIQAGATVLDFAFKIHSEIGQTCVGARVNNKFVPLGHMLQNGDTVQILTNKKQSPKKGWVDFVTTTRAKAKIIRAIKEEEFGNAKIGKEILKKKLEQWKFVFNDAEIKKICTKFNYSDTYELYQDVGSGKLDISKIREFMAEVRNMDTAQKEVVEIPEKVVETQTSKHTTKDYLVIDNSFEHINYHRSKCCSPIPGDDIFGFITVNNGTSIHRRNCPNAADLILRYPYRIVKAQWSEQLETNTFQADIFTAGADRIGLVSDITLIIAQSAKVNLRAFNIESKNDGTFSGTLSLLVGSNEQLNFIMHKIRSLRGVHKVVRR